MDTAERLLVKRAMEADQEAFNLLINKYYKSIYVFAYQKVGHLEEAQDIAQDVFVKAFRGLSSLKYPERFGSWIFQIAQRHIIDWYRKNRRVSKLSLQSLEELGFDLPQPPSQSDFDPELFQKVMLAVAQLPEAYRLVITLRFLEGLSSKEIAQRLGEPDGTIRCRLSRAGTMLRKRLIEATREST